MQLLGTFGLLAFLCSCLCLYFRAAAGMADDIDWIEEDLGEIEKNNAVQTKTKHPNVCPPAVLTGWPQGGIALPWERRIIVPRKHKHKGT